MAKSKVSSALPEGQADIETLKKRYDELNVKKIQAAANQKTAEESLAKLKEQALRDYGTDNLDALKQQLADLQAENERKRAEYQAHLEAIEAKLAEVEEQHKAAS